MKKVYLAGPDVFWPNAKAAGAAKVTLCAEYGLQGHFPLDTELDLSGLTPYEAGLAIYRANLHLMDDSDLLIANMTPFRGPSMDVGTAFEMGYMAARRKPVWGYTLDGRLYSDRVNQPTDGCDEQGDAVEQFDMADNLMMIGAINDSNGQLIKAKDEQSLEHHLKVFRALLETITA
ncbi:nucleoside 2-deoxyribosyltransferase [Pontibacterium granulatum]|uniref:nucleoside 2-deoxyribosyltransferase n=1 Tax=Pontibacterium granulatum TaxID=2036029 RepID=UPI00249B2CA4|nr:nucleoside 2-deoxyribosyltransferase [Pontibacterium granulatum]MDI3325877.1 nucleoside 2-deoxyribosyltransferase [Pontibacterium granulatum]